MPRGENFSSIFRRGTGKRYAQRPPANCIAARRAWDSFAKKGPVLWIQLLDGYWGCCRNETDSVEEHEAIHYRRKWI